MPETYIQTTQGGSVHNSTCAVIVTYNRKELLKKCLEAVFHQEDAGCDALIIDNDSSDGTGEMIAEIYGADPRLHYINTGANLGGAGGFQIGVREAVRRKYDYVWMMDDDTIPSPTALKQFFVADRELQGDWGFLISAAYWTDGNICRMNIPKTTIFRHVSDEDYRRHINKVRMCSFVSLLVPASVIREVGLPIGEYFIWTDDYEFTGRISSQHPCYMVPDSTVTHAMARHMRVSFAREEGERLERYQYIYRNDVHCYRRYGIQGWAYIILKDLYTAVDILLHSKGRRLQKIKVMLHGFRMGLHFHPVIEPCQGDNSTDTTTERKQELAGIVSRG